MIDPDKYEFQGDEFLDRFDRLQAARKTVDQFFENGDSNSLEFYVGELEDAHNRLDKLFEEEYMKFPIQTVETDENEFRSTSVRIMETDAENYGEIVEKLEEINDNLSERDPSLDYSEVPSPIAFVDYSGELIGEWYSLQETYGQL